LQLLKKLKLVSFTSINRKNDTIKLCSWEQLEQILDIDIAEQLTFQYNINDEQKIYQWIIAAEIQENKNRQDAAVIRKLNKNPECYTAVFSALIKYGADAKKLNNASYFLSMMKSFYFYDFVQVSDIHDILIEFRPDNNRGVRTMADHWKAKNPQLVSYWKSVLQKSKIIDITKVQIESQERARNKHCKVLWLTLEKQTMLCLCDQIEILKPVIQTIQPIQPGVN
jgi:hypothetical protein